MLLAPPRPEHAFKFNFDPLLLGFTGLSLSQLTWLSQLGCRVSVVKHMSNRTWQRLLGSGIGIPSRNVPPVDNVPDCLEIVWTDILVLQVVCVLPDVDSQDGYHVLHIRVSPIPFTTKRCDHKTPDHTSSEACSISPGREQLKRRKGQQPVSQGRWWSQAINTRVWRPHKTRLVGTHVTHDTVTLRVTVAPERQRQVGPGWRL